MKFTVSTKPLIDGLVLGILDANINNIYERSTLAQVSVKDDALVINLEAALIYTEIKIKGKRDGDDDKVIFVDNKLMRKLVSTFEAPTTTFEFNDDGLTLYSGKSKFTLPKMLDADITFKSPAEQTADATTLNQDSWAFIKNYQLYAIAMSFINPVYTKIWVSESNDVLTGDFDIGLFTHSTKGNLNGEDCLITDTIVNLITATPEGTKLYKVDGGYVIHVVTDGFELKSEFTPKHESDEDMGSYNADIILNMMHEVENPIIVDTTALNKVLKQAACYDNREDIITMSVEEGDPGSIVFTNDLINCKVPLATKVETSYSLQFRTVLLQKVMLKCTDDKVQISPTMREGEITGISISTKDLTTVLAGLE